MKKTITFVAALLLCVGAFAEPYTLNFVEWSQTNEDDSTIYVKGVETIFGAEALVYVDAINTRDNVYPARVGCGAKFGTSSEKGILAFTLANPTEVDSIVISAAKYSGTEGADGFKVFIVNQTETETETAFFTLSADKSEFENCVWKPAGEVTTIRINQTTAAKQRFYVKSITIYPKKAVETAIEQTTDSDGSKKVLRNGQVVILREDKAYNLFGQEIAD